MASPSSNAGKSLTNPASGPAIWQSPEVALGVAVGGVPYPFLLPAVDNIESSGASALQALATVALALGTARTVSLRGGAFTGIATYSLVDGGGDGTETRPTRIVPADFNDSTNNKVWLLSAVNSGNLLVNGGVTVTTSAGAALLYCFDATGNTAFGSATDDGPYRVQISGAARASSFTAGDPSAGLAPYALFLNTGIIYNTPDGLVSQSFPFNDSTDGNSGTTYFPAASATRNTGTLSACGNQVGLHAPQTTYDAPSALKNKNIITNLGSVIELDQPDLDLDGTEVVIVTYGAGTATINASVYGIYLWSTGVPLAVNSIAVFTFFTSPVGQWVMTQYGPLATP